MTRPFYVNLRPGEKIYLNGAVMRVNRKVSLELMNNVTFLLENHVLQLEDANTPLRQLYYVLQTMLIDPALSDQAQQIYDDMIGSLISTFKTTEIVEVLEKIDELVKKNRVFEALKTLRSAFSIEDGVLAQKLPKLMNLEKVG